jgi:hypothetical protein
LEQALALDAAFRTLAAQRDAVAAPARPWSVSDTGLADSGGRRLPRQHPRAREGTELNLDVAAPVWLPGQRTAYGRHRPDRRGGVRRLGCCSGGLEVAGVLR